MMESLSAPPTNASEILRLRRADRAAAGRAMAALSLDDQVAAICEAPLARRAEMLDLAPLPEQVVPLLPEAELCFTVKAIGLADAVWLLELATPEQVVACVDLDAWSGTALDPLVLNEWMDALAGTGDEALLRSIRALDPEIVVLFLKSRVGVVQKPDDDEGWDPPDGGKTLEGQFYFVPLGEGDDASAIEHILRVLFQNDYWRYFRMMQGVVWELETETSEFAQRWRSGRLEDLGFPPWDDAMRIYRYLPEKEREAIPDGPDPLNVGAWHMPVWVPDLPTGREASQPIFQALARLAEHERRPAFFAFVAVANKIAVADKMTLSDAESTPRAIEKAARLMSRGLELLAERRALDPTDVVRRVSLERLFRIGANLDPENARL